MGTGFTVIATVDVAAGQKADGTLVVRVAIAVPEVMEGVNWVVNALGGLKLPEAELHVTEVAEPPNVPVRVTVPPAQTVTGAPALTVGGGYTETVTWAVAVQPEAVTVSV